MQFPVLRQQSNAKAVRRKQNSATIMETPVSSHRLIQMLNYRKGCDAQRCLYKKRKLISSVIGFTFLGEDTKKTSTDLSTVATVVVIINY